MGITAFNDVLDDRTRNSAKQGVKASRKIQLGQYEASLATLDAAGIDVPHRTFDPENAREYPTTAHINDTTVHLYHNVHERSTDSFGSFDNIDDDVEDVTWTVVNLEDETVNLTVVNDWGKRREVPYGEFADKYEPIYLETEHGKIPNLGY